MNIGEIDRNNGSAYKFTWGHTYYHELMHLDPVVASEQTYDPVYGACDIADLAAQNGCEKKPYKYWGEWSSLLNADSWAQFASTVYFQSVFNLGEPGRPDCRMNSFDEDNPELSWGGARDRQGDSFNAQSPPPAPASAGPSTPAPTPVLPYDPAAAIPKGVAAPYKDAVAFFEHLSMQSSDPKPADGGGHTPIAGSISQDGDVKCNGLESLKYISTQDLDQNIDDFCTQADKQGTQDAGSGSIQRSFNVKTPEEISISVDWPPGLADFKPTKDACKTHMSAISKNCDGNNPANPMNWKGGGTFPVKLGGVTITYHIQPIAKRPKLFTVPLAHVETSGLKFWLNGSGWSNKDTGDCIQSNLNGCLGSQYDFRYGIGNDDREWTMTGWAGPGQANCCHDAIITCGGPDIPWQ